MVATLTEAFNNYNFTNTLPVYLNTGQSYIYLKNINANTKENDIISQVKDLCNKYSDCTNSYLLSIEDSNNLREIKGINQ